MINRTLRRVAIGATVAATSLTGLGATAHADGCVDIDETFPKFVQTGNYQVTEVCSVINILRPANLSTTKGRGYWLADGRVLWLSEAEWWDLLDKAVADEAWRHENRDLLVALGIVSCHFELIPTIERVEVTERYRLCPPTWDPYERPWEPFERP
jgi:hypothetical protein